MIGAYARLGKTWIETPLQRRDCIIVLLRKKVIKQAVGGAEQKSEILAIPNQYKNTLDDLVDSSDIGKLFLVDQGALGGSDPPIP